MMRRSRSTILIDESEDHENESEDDGDDGDGAVHVRRSSATAPSSSAPSASAATVSSILSWLPQALPLPEDDPNDMSYEDTMRARERAGSIDADDELPWIGWPGPPLMFYDEQVVEEHDGGGDESEDDGDDGDGERTLARSIESLSRMTME